MRPKTLRGRLSVAYAAALVAGLVAFALFAVVLIDRVQRASADGQLFAQARAAAAFVAPEPGTTAPEIEDPAQFRRLVGVGSNGALIAPGGRVLLSSVVDVPDGVRALGTGGAHGARIADLRADGATLRAAAVAVSVRDRVVGTVVVWRALGTIADVDRRIAIGFALAIPLITVLAALASRAVAGRALAPLAELAALAAQIEASDLTRRLHRTGDDELGKLCATFDRMLARLERAFVRQRRFASDVAHELRAPLAVMLAEIDVARRRTRTPPEYERTLDAVRSETLGLDTLTSDLLAAYRNDDLPRREPLQLDALVRDAAARIAALAHARNVAVALEPVDRVTIRGECNELTRALVAILENAFKYGGPDRTVHVAVIGRAREGADDVASVTIRDEGPGFTAEALAHALERFWRDDAARTRDGTGLGLSLADALVHRSGGTLSLANDPRGGAVVRLIFPRESGANSSPRHVGVVV